MPLFQIEGSGLRSVEQTNFDLEKELQQLVETNLEVVFNCRFVASEFPTGSVHAGRIDTLALSEDSNPVILEYKKVASSELINQSLYYLHWLRDHKGDFAMAVQAALGPAEQIDWSEIRVITIAPSYKKYDLHAVQVMGANIELWSYRLFDNQTIFLEEVFTSTPVESGATTSKSSKGDGPTPPKPVYSFEDHLEGKPEAIRNLALHLDEYVMDLDGGLERSPKKLYVAYRTTQNIACAEVQHQKILLFLKLDPDVDSGPPGISRDVRNIGHYGTGDLEVTLRNPADLDAAKPFIEKAYQKIGS